MTREEAHRVLDAARDGEELPEWLISSALVVTGDLQPGRVQCTWAQAITSRGFDAQPLNA